MAGRISTFNVEGAPVALGNYSHAVSYGDLIFTCGVGPRDPQTNEVPGLVYGPDNKKFKHDIRLETKATLENLKTILEGAGSSLDRVLEVNVFLVDMGDFAAMNEIFRDYFTTHQPVRTTLGITALPGDISVEMKAVATRG